MFRTFGVYLLYASVFMRATVLFSDDPWQPLALLILYGLLLVSQNPFRRDRADTQDPKQRRRRVILLLLQAGLVFALLLIPPHRDFLSLLFLPLSLQAVQDFGWRAGRLPIAGFILATVGTLLAAEEGLLFGGAMALFYSGLYILFGRYAHLIHAAELARGENHRLFGELEIQHRQLMNYTAQVQDLAIAEARGRMARELHDSVTQTVFSMNLTVQAARILLEKDPGQVEGQIDHLLALAKGAQGEIQVLLSELRPRTVTEGGLAAALSRLAAERQSLDGLQVRLETCGQRDLPEPVVDGLFRIAQEALNNVSRHSGTSQATVRLNLEAAPAFLEVEDCGSGFDPKAATGLKGHIGLSGMAERARELGWRLAIDSWPGHGTRIRVEEGA